MYSRRESRNHTVVLRAHIQPGALRAPAYVEVIGLCGGVKKKLSTTRITVFGDPCSGKISVKNAALTACSS